MVTLARDHHVKALVGAALGAALLALAWLWSGSAPGSPAVPEAGPRPAPSAPATAEAPAALGAASRPEAQRVAPTPGPQRPAAAAPSAPHVPDPPAPLPAAPRLAGFVVTPDGRPAAGAEVALGTLAELAATQRAAALRVATSDDAGRFEFVDVRDDAVRLTASHTEHAPSDTLALRVATVRAAEDLVLRLRRGAVVRGEVFRPDHAPAPGRRVQIVRDGGGMQVTETDTQGAFTFARLAPGRWSVATFPGKDEMVALEALGFKGPDLVHLAQEMLELADAEDRFVSLGGPSPRSVRVHGRITSGGEPRPRLMQWLAERSRSLALQRVVMPTDDGAYEVVVAEPGPYLVRLSDSRGGASCDALVVVPEGVRELRHDITLSRSTLSGSVLDDDGAPVGGAHVQLRCVRGPWRGPLTTMQATTVVGEDGAFVIRDLPAGAWSLSASLPPAKPAQAAAAPRRVLAPVPTAPIEVAEGTTLAGVVVRVTAGQELSGRCVDELGLGLGGAGLLVHTADGRPLQSYTRGGSAASGAFTGPPVGPGHHSVIAVHGDLCSEPFVLPAALEDRAPLTLTLSLGGTLTLRFAGPHEAWLTSVDVTDAAGRSFKDLVAHSASQLDYLAGYRPGLQRFGPLPPGRYRVSAGAGAPREVAVTAGREVVLDLAP